MPYPPPIPRSGPLDRFRAALTGAGYTEDAISSLLDMTTFPAPGTPAFGRAMFRSRAGRPFDVLARMFLLGATVEEETVNRALDPATVADLVTLGLARVESGYVVPQVTILELDGLYLACDPPAQIQPATFADMVNGPTDPTAALERFAIKRRSGATLDLGTGCGYLALLAARWSGRVAAADVNARALAFTAFNAALNGIPVEPYVGDLFAPVEGQQFDLILSNPPFLITPGQRLVYRDGGMSGDAFSRRVVRESAPRLAESGFLQLVFEWIHPSGVDADQRLESWFEGLGCDAWVFRTITMDPLKYAEERIAATEPPGDHEPVFQQWMESYRSQGVEAISTGYLAMRRRSGGENWFRLEALEGGMPDDFGPSVERRFRLHDVLRQSGDAALLTAPLRLASAVRLARGGAVAPGGVRLDRRELTLGRRSVGINGSLEQFLTMLDGRTPVLQILDGMENGEAAARQLVPFLRDMVEQGFLLLEPPVH